MKPPMFPAPPAGSRPQQYLHRARMFRAAAIGLPSYLNGETNWPAYALMLHACELALKAYCDQAVATGGKEVRAGNHDLKGWYGLARHHGLPADPRVSDGIDLLAEIHSSHYTRYPDEQRIRPKDLSATNEVADAHRRCFGLAARVTHTQKSSSRSVAARQRSCHTCCRRSTA